MTPQRSPDNSGKKCFLTIFDFSGEYSVSSSWVAKEEALLLAQEEELLLAQEEDLLLARILNGFHKANWAYT